VAFVVDLTERKRAEAELRDAERRNLDAQLQLAHVNRIATMGQLTASIAHEINQPIGAILMNASTALRWLNAQPPELERATQSIDRIAADSKRAGEIINRTRDLIKNAPERKESLQVNEAILEVIGLTRSEMLDSDVRVQTRMADDLPPILGDRVQLQQVILNLIMNAIEAMNEISEGKRELLISTSKAEADGVLVAVSDSGPGLPQADPERVFEAFYTTKSSGLGMGLSICRSIIEAHGGRLWATPNEPHGAVFCILLPIAKMSREDLASSVA
jgi:C4-dicarboxylate-specific signal transduction histidine kinase